MLFFTRLLALFGLKSDIEKKTLSAIRSLVSLNTCAVFNLNPSLPSSLQHPLPSCKEANVWPVATTPRPWPEAKLPNSRYIFYGEAWT